MARFKQVEGFWQLFGSMLNTGLIVASVLDFFIEVGGWVERVESDIRANTIEIARVERDADAKRGQIEKAQSEKWSAHDDLHKNRLAEVSKLEAAIGERLKALEKQANDDDRRLAGFEYRTTILENMTENISTAIKELQMAFNRQSGDIQVMKEILQRMEATINRVPQRRS
ncbi:hypothetical protein [Agrobacterium larrymoorei]|uniref:Coiled-coil protein SlyX n=1 Tax=Agrobacterium larrymoorei TaxID=160699 RepID=A0ABU0UMU3_9HYPH|nr:hypothetical protein [Agrobacterium larrymoorei]MDQ1186098.1 putative coiled-coil protein SlyX [Agrobacterium larrymoorei]